MNNAYLLVKRREFRIWAKAVLREFIIKGFVPDDERLKQVSRLGKDWIPSFSLTNMTFP
ncbi:RhuM family protein [Ravibacter arvi]|uniref:RhuM family protein n=1 Tax=Ravibacter arvi TaxID=2051041 RepID=UPI003CD0C389